MLAVVALVVLYLTWRSMLAWSSHGLGVAWSFLAAWVYDHPRPSLAIFVFAVLDFVAVYLAHRAGRGRAWIFSATFMFLLWLLFWYGTVIPSLKSLLRLDYLSLRPLEVVVSGLLMIGINAVFFAIMEAKEEHDKKKAKK